VVALDYFIGVTVFVFGTIIGSFLNVVVLRWGSGISIGGRSFCFSCSRQLRWYELFPVVSFFAFSRHCRTCKTKLSWQYPLVEGLTGALFLLIFLRHDSFFPTLYYFAIISILVVIGVYDIHHKIIPNSLAYAFAALAFLFLIWSSYPSYLDGKFLLDMIAGPLLFLPFFLLWFFSSGTWMGLGDAKLALGIGWFLGIARGVSAIVLGFWIGAFVALSFMALSRFSHSKYLHLRLSKKLKNLTMKSEIPFAPFLIVGVLLVFFLSFDVLGLSVFLT